MARREYKYHYIYKIINTKSNQYYIGMHSTHNLDDGYMGGGKRITNSIRKYGKEGHTKEILEYFDDREALRNREMELVNSDLLNDPLCMNLQLGGGGGFINLEHCKKCSIAGGKGFSEMVKNNLEFRIKLQNLGASTFKNAWANGKFDNMIPGFKDKKHTEEAKKLIGKNSSINQKGEKNSNFGTRWVNKNQVDKIIPGNEFDDYIKSGWIKGRYGPLSNIRKK